MKNSSFLEISLKHLKRKENIVYGLIFIILVVILFLILSFINLIIGYRRDSNKYDILARTILVQNEHTNQDFDKINTIKHVKINVTDKYYYQFSVLTKEFDVENSKGEIRVKAVVEKDTLKIVDGRSIQNDKEILIPSIFYPHGPFTDDGKEIIIKENFIDGKNLIGKEIEIASSKDYPFRFLYPEYNSSNIKEEELLRKKWEEEILKPYLEKQTKYLYKIVGTYDSTYNMSERNIVFVSMKDLDDIKNEIKGGTSDTDENGTFVFNPDKYDDRMIIVDNYKNVEYVSEELTKMGFINSTVRSYDDIQYKLLTYVPLSIAIIVLFVAIKLMKKFISKKYNNIHYELGIFKALGYNNNQIIKIELYENIAITIIGIIISFILFLIAFNVIINVVPIFIETEYYSVTIRVPYLYISIFIIGIFLYVIYINKRISGKHLKQNTCELLKEY